jgi:hypothetical protein
MSNLRDRKRAEAFLVRKGRASPAEAARLSELALAERVLAADGRRKVVAGQSVAARKWEIECEARRMREARR